MQVTDQIDLDAHAVFLPILQKLEIDDAVRRFLAGGGKAVLFGESADEYRARRMSAERTTSETPVFLKAATAELRRIQDDVIVAVDQELGGLCRLHSLVPAFPTIEEARSMPSDQLRTACAKVASAARALGVNLFLAPVLDYTVGRNVWLEGRTLSEDPSEVGRLGADFVTGVQSAGVAATAKHFPGFCRLDGDPATEDVRFLGTEAEYLRGLAVFEAVFAAGVQAVMNGPAIVEHLDPLAAPSISKWAVAVLKEKYRFRGLIISDDLDSKATMRDASIEEVAIKGLEAGTHLMLVAGDDHLPSLIRSVADAARAGRLSKESLRTAAEAVRSFAATLARPIRQS